ncbi:MAG: VOC family protein [Rubrobacter sp.]|nr:VOC family protein [Rubrobacter sp.]
MISGLDHLVILVEDLGQAMRGYERLGFVVTSGGEHADGLTRNALIPFHDGSYLEIVAFLDLDDPRDNVWGWRRFAATGGIVDHCLTSSDLAADVGMMREAGLQLEGPDDGGRRLPDGEEIRWRSASIEQEGRALPFLIEDVTPRSRRVPAGQAAEHQNGATGISALEISAPDPEEAARAYAAMVGNPEAREEGRMVHLGSCEVSFAESAGAAGPRAVRLAVRTGGVKEDLNPDLTFGSRIRLG